MQEKVLFGKAVGSDNCRGASCWDRLTYRFHRSGDPDRQKKETAKAVSGNMVGKVELKCVYFKSLDIKQQILSRVAAYFLS